MAICWYCHWGWPKPVADIYLEALDKLNGNDWILKLGPSHLVWEDENFDAAERCLENFDEWRSDESDDQAQIVRWSLEELVKIPLEERELWPDDYDGLNPQDYPPPEGIEMVKV